MLPKYKVMDEFCPHHEHIFTKQLLADPLIPWFWSWSRRPFKPRGFSLLLNVLRATPRISWNLERIAIPYLQSHLLTPYFHYTLHMQNLSLLANILNTSFASNHCSHLIKSPFTLPPDTTRIKPCLLCFDLFFVTIFYNLDLSYFHFPLLSISKHSYNG